MLTAYDYSTARLIDEAGVNAILVGDSLGMVVLGYEDTLSVTMEDISITAQRLPAASKIHCSSPTCLLCLTRLPSMTLLSMPDA